MNNTVTKTIRDIMEKKEVGVNQLARTMGKTPSTISDRINQKNISINKLNELLKMLDYQIAVIPITAEIPEGGYAIVESEEVK